jgi:hypothetical protein
MCPKFAMEDPADIAENAGLSALGEMVQRALHFAEKLEGHCPREAVADEDALDDEIFAVGRHRVGGNEPAALAQSIGES